MPRETTARWSRSSPAFRRRRVPSPGRCYIRARWSFQCGLIISRALRLGADGRSRQGQSVTKDSPYRQARGRRATESFFGRAKAAVVSECGLRTRFRSGDMAKVAAVILLDNARGVEREARAALSKGAHPAELPLGVVRNLHLVTIRNLAAVDGLKGIATLPS